MIIDEELVDEILTFIESVWGKLPDEDFENQAESIYDKMEKALKSTQSALAEQPALATCKTCNGNDGDAPPPIPTPSPT